MDFVSKKNIDLLWEILSEQSIIKNTDKTKKEMIYDAFTYNLIYFYEKEKNEGTNASLISLNKKFLTQMLKVLHNEINNITKIKEKAKPIYKAEDIAASRQEQFEKQLAQKRSEFETAVTIVKPPVLDFSEKIEDEKIKGMDELIAKTVAQRNFDISQINVPIVNEKWLKPQETNVKLEKTNKNERIEQKSTPLLMRNNNEMRYIKIEDSLPNNIVKNEIIELPDQNAHNKLKNILNNKKISWNNSNEIKYFEENEIIDNDESSYILSKLKKVKENEQNEQNEQNEIILHLKEDNTFLKERLSILEKELDILKTELKNVKNITM
jgi:hypothetical protein